MADVCNRSDCITENQYSEMKGMQEKESIMGVRVDSKIRLSGSSLVMPDSDPGDGCFYLFLTPMIDSYNLHSKTSGYYIMFYSLHCTFRCRYNL